MYLFFNFTVIVYAVIVVPGFSPFPHLHPASPCLLPKPIPILLSVPMACA